jgi:hypothetical protein
VTAEEKRLEQARLRQVNWKRWGPYVSERAWGTVREDYSATGEAWDYFPHDHARSRAYRWNEDGIAGISDRHQRLCFALALWNGRDPILKERLFGLNGEEGNHGEDVKECYFYLDNTPTHSYMRYLYKYPQAEFPYELLVKENKRRTKADPEFELLDTGIFQDHRYFDVMIEYAKVEMEDICIKITATNRGPEVATLHLLPTLWFRNTWSWDFGSPRPEIEVANSRIAAAALRALNDELGEWLLYCDGDPALLFTENETNFERLFNVPNSGPYVKDAFHHYVVQGQQDAVNPSQVGTKAAAYYQATIAPGEHHVLKLRLTNRQFSPGESPLGAEFGQVFLKRHAEADEFYAAVIPSTVTGDMRAITRQALAGLLWCKQYYNYEVRRWLQGDSTSAPPPAERQKGRNKAWVHLYNADVLSMPDKWEYPWYAAWDLAFHCIALALVDPDYAKDQLVLMLREWYMHPNGQIPAYEWAFGDVNPPVHAWAAYRVYKIEEGKRGKGDRVFLERIFQKLLLNFTWWVNRKDEEGMNVFQGGFLGLDNIGVFDRNMPMPNGGHLEQSDGTSWMAMYSLDMLTIALELAQQDPVYSDVASKFWEHFVYIASAMNNLGGNGISLWDEQGGFFYDVLHYSNGDQIPLRVRSMVGLIPLFAVQTLEPDLLAKLPDFKVRLDWFINNRPDLTRNLACMKTRGMKERRLLSIAGRSQLECICKVMLDEHEFLSPFGIRALSRYHRDHPYSLMLNDAEHTVDYEPGESTAGLFGGNSNWRGPIWFPVNYLLIESLRKFYHYFGGDFKVECPTGSGKWMNLSEVADELSRRLYRIFERDENGRRPVFGDRELFHSDPHWRDLILFHEYFHGDTGCGLGASHQTGWTALVAKLIHEHGDREEKNHRHEANHRHEKNHNEVTAASASPGAGDK